MEEGEIYKVLVKEGPLSGSFLKVVLVNGDDVLGDLCRADGSIRDESLGREYLSARPLTKRETIAAFRRASDAATMALFEFFSEPKNGK